MFTLQNLHGQIDKFTDVKFDFNDHITTLVDRDLFAFKSHNEDNMIVTKYENVILTGADPRASTKSVVAKRGSRFNFCITNYKNSVIFICGGVEKGFLQGVQQSVLQFSVENYQFSSAPSMNEARRDASATSINDSVYVFGGWNGYNP